jgi:hypothetical protein
MLEAGLTNNENGHDVLTSGSAPSLTIFLHLTFTIASQEVISNHPLPLCRK